MCLGVIVDDIYTIKDLSLVVFNTGWSEDQVYCELERVLGSEIIDLSKPHPR